MVEKLKVPEIHSLSCSQLPPLARGVDNKLHSGSTLIWQDFRFVLILGSDNLYVKLLSEKGGLDSADIPMKNRFRLSF